MVHFNVWDNIDVIDNLLWIWEEHPSDNIISAKIGHIGWIHLDQLLPHARIHTTLFLSLNLPETSRLSQIMISQASVLIGCLLLLLLAPETSLYFHGREISLPIVTKAITHNPQTYTQSTAWLQSCVLCLTSQVRGITVFEMLNKQELWN